ncbi:MAG: ppk2 [Magnetococcales bacterium]|nr:ppk2 [Magnetococcales bacterium]
MENPEIVIDGEKKLSLQQLLEERQKLLSDEARLRKDFDKLEKEHTKAVLKRRQEQELKPYQAELIRMQHYLEDEVKRMIILLEGRDAAGKGGTIRRMTRYMNEKHYRVVALGKPTEVQLTQWFYQRYVEQFPTGGECVMFDRSWYNRAMVEPVFNFCTPEQYENFMSGVTGFEKDIVREGTILLKLYFSVSKKEQKYRFDRRRHDPLRQWKLSEVDMQAQDKWDDFTKMKYAMLRRTHTLDAPWTIIRSDNKHLARLNAIKAVLNAVPFKKTEGLDMTTDADIVISGFRELEYMEAERISEGKFIA